MNEREGGRLLVDQLVAQGVERAFTVPGESFLAALDGFYEARDKVKLVVCRHEAAAANMAEAYGKLTNQPGIAFVTRGPGATHASIGVHTAFQDSTPMILFVGDVGSRFRHREAFQEVDFAAMFAPLAKWAVRIDEADRIPELVARAFQVATSGRRGPVVVALPEDMLTQKSRAADAKRHVPAEPHPGAGELLELQRLLGSAKRPFVILGGTGWTAKACEQMRRFIEANDLPVGCAFRFQDLFDNRNEHYVGDVGIGINPVLAERVRMADVLLVVGARLGEMTTSGYTLLEAPMPRQKLVHVHPSAEEIGRVYQPELGIVSSMAPFAAAVAALTPAQSPAWKGSAAEAHADYIAWSGRREIPGKVQMWDVVDWLNQHMPEDTIYCNGAGNFATWLHRFHRYTGFRTQVAPTSGAMGYGVPAAIAASLRFPDRCVVAVAGDGDFLMNGQELATAVQYGADLIVIVIDNRSYGTIRMHQERAYPGRVAATDLANPDFAMLASAFGAWSRRVESTDVFGEALAEAKGRSGVRLLHCLTDVEQLSAAGATVSGLRAQG
jgi:acetolactate synthase-1/2/3 large subunit